jgi:hypothetical protein
MPKRALTPLNSVRHVPLMNRIDDDDDDKFNDDDDFPHDSRMEFRTCIFCCSFEHFS